LGKRAVKKEAPRGEGLGEKTKKRFTYRRRLTQEGRKPREREGPTRNKKRGAGEKNVHFAPQKQGKEGYLGRKENKVSSPRLRDKKTCGAPAKRKEGWGPKKGASTAHDKREQKVPWGSRNEGIRSRTYAKGSKPKCSSKRRGEGIYGPRQRPLERES